MGPIYIFHTWPNNSQAVGRWERAEGKESKLANGTFTLRLIVFRFQLETRDASVRRDFAGFQGQFETCVAMTSWVFTRGSCSIMLKMRRCPCWGPSACGEQCTSVRRGQSSTSWEAPVKEKHYTPGTPHSTPGMVSLLTLAHVTILAQLENKAWR
jgi:hypothetical protein